MNRSLSAPSRTFLPVLAASAVLFSSALSAQAQSCSPGVPGMFGFKVGDVLQYRETKASPVAGQPSAYTEVIRKVKVESRESAGRILTYGVSALIRSTFKSPVPGASRPPTFEAVHEDWVFHDTVGNPFAGCPRDIVPMPDAQGFDSHFETRVEFRDGDASVWALARPGQRIKLYGLQLGTSNGRDTIYPIMDYGHTEAYAESLGVVRSSKGGMMGTSYTLDLVGYAKDGKTVGTVNPDAYFWNDVSIHPHAARPGRILRFEGGIGEKAFDPAGRLLARGSKAPVLLLVR